MTFVDWIVSLWKEVCFAVVVESWEQGVRFRRGVPQAKALGAGVWFFVPFFHRIEVIPIQLRFIDLPIQRITTKDGIEIALSANIGYAINDAVLAYVEVHDYEESLARLAAGHLHRRVHAWTYPELVENLGKLEESLEGTLTTRSKRWGIEIRVVGVTDMVRQRAYSLLSG
jgi:regulator of protease activity HflC (stomatin/prohibitin superfamily)